MSPQASNPSARDPPVTPDEVQTLLNTVKETWPRDGDSNSEPCADRCSPFRNREPKSPGAAQCRQVTRFATRVAIQRRHGPFKVTSSNDKTGPGPLGIGGIVLDVGACAGGPARVEMEILGPSRIALTMNTYARVIQELRKNAAERIEASSNPLAIIRNAGEGWLHPGGGEVSLC